MKIRTAALPALALAAVASLVAAAPAPAAAPSPAPAAASAPAAAPTPSAAPRTASVQGAGRISYPYSPDHEIRFSVDAEGVPWSKPFPVKGLEKGLPTDARGLVTVYHRVPASESPTGKEFVGRAVAEVDCLVTGGRTATLTAVVKKSNTGNEKQRIGISIEEGRGGEPDRLGFSWGVGNLDVGKDGKPGPAVTGTCMAPAAFARVVEGGFKVAAAPLAPEPK
ncbi:hypothetical protein [Streptomyces sp. NPDC048603]|uniref:hypothetical protein n=1 Tax=Streptomyces sp. NPDC048603 TaxID=3365577 RepID=UPI0037132CA1